MSSSAKRTPERKLQVVLSVLHDQFWSRYEEAGLEEHGKKMQELYGRFLGRILGDEPDIEHLAGLIEMTIFDAPEKPDALDVAA